MSLNKGKVEAIVLNFIFCTDWSYGSLVKHENKWNVSRYQIHFRGLQYFGRTNKPFGPATSNLRTRGPYSTIRPGLVLKLGFSVGNPICPSLDLFLYGWRHPTCVGSHFTLKNIIVGMAEIIMGPLGNSRHAMSGFRVSSACAALG
jgi:hypothetical protein